MIDQVTIEKIVDAAQIVDVVSDFITLRKRGVNYWGLCPFHDDKTPSLSVSPSKGIFKCFSCGKGGNTVHFVMEHEQITYVEALRYLAKKYGIEINERELTDEDRKAQTERESLFNVNQFAKNYFRDLLHQHEEGKSIGMAYFRSRGFRDDIIEKFQLGYALNSRDAFAREAVAKGFRPAYITGAGLCYQRDNGDLTDRFAGRVIFPWLSLSGKVVAFGGRLLDSRTKGVSQKYVNSPDSDIYHKDHELYGIFQAKRAIVKEDCVYMVEGYTDVISMHQCGIENVVANSGTALSLYQIKVLRRFTPNIVLLYDSDEAGIHAAIRGTDMLLAEGMNVKVCLLPEGEDPDSFARTHSSSEYQVYIQEHATDFIRFKTGLLLKDMGDDPIKRARLIGELVQTISVIPEAIVRDVYIKDCAELLRVEDKLLVNEVAKRREQKSIQASVQKEREQRQAAALENAVSQAIGEASQPNEAPIRPATEGAEAADATVPTANLPTTAAPIQVVGSQTERLERMMIQMVVRYGEKVMCTVTDDNGRPIRLTVIEYLHTDLSQDDLELKNSLYRTILSLAVEHVGDAGFCAEHYFVNHPDPQVSQLSAELITDRYQLSKYHYKNQTIHTDEERLAEIVPILSTSYKYNLINEEKKELMRELQNPLTSKDKERCASIMNRIIEIQKIQSLMSKQLGDRVILSF